MTRDFSQSTVTQLYSTINSIKNDGQWGIVDFFTDLWESVPDMSDVDAYRRAVLDKYDVGESDLDKILQTVESVDSTYQMQLIACSSALDEFAQRIRNVADMITPAVVSSDPNWYSSIGQAIAANYTTVARDADQFVTSAQGGIDQMLDEQQAWYEKLLNGVGGFAVGLLDSAVFGAIGELYGAFDQVAGTHFQRDWDFMIGIVNRSIEDNMVTNDEWYFGGKTVGDAVGVVAGVVMAVAGIATIFGSFTVTIGGVVLSGTGVGAIVGVPAIAVSVAGVAEGAAMVTGGIAMMSAGEKNAGDDWAASQASDERTVPHYEGKLKPSGDKDAEADAYAAKYGGQSSQLMDSNPHEIDVVDDTTLTEIKSGAVQYGSRLRRQADAYFEMAKATGRSVRYRFIDGDDSRLITHLQHLSDRTGVTLIIEYGPI